MSDHSAHRVLKRCEVGPGEPRPEMHPAVVAGAYERLAVWRGGDALDWLWGNREPDAEWFVSGDLPKPGRTALACGGQHVSVGTEGNRVDALGIRGGKECPQAEARSPEQTDTAVDAARGE